MVGVRDPPKITTKRLLKQIVLLGLQFPSQGALSKSTSASKPSGLGFQLESGR